MQNTEEKNGSRGRIVVHFLLGVYALILAYIVLGLIFQFAVPAEIFFGLSFALLFFTLAQAIYELGFRNALIFLLITSTVGFLAEVLGTNSGFPFGKYYYTDFLGEKVLGVPVVVPLVWFVIAYVAFSIARTSFGGANTGKVPLVQLALLSAFGAVAWDFMIDPMFSSYGYWVWTGQFVQLPELNGIPLTNFVGWFVLVALMVYLCSQVILRGTSGKITYRKNTLDSEIAYALLVLDGVVANYSLHNYLVIGIGLVAMVAFLIVSHAAAKKPVMVDSPVRVVNPS